MRNFTKIHWQDSARQYALEFGLQLEDVEKIIRTTERYEKDPHSADLGHLVMRYYSGDISVVVGHREVKEPIIMHVRVNTHQNSKIQTAGSGSGSTLPTTTRELRKRVIAMGYKIQPGTKHDKIIDPKNKGYIVGTIPTTPSDFRSIPNNWRQFMRYHLTKKEEERA